MIELSQEQKNKVQEVHNKLKSLEKYEEYDKYLVAATRYDIDNMNKLLEYLENNPDVDGEQIQKYIYSEIVEIDEYNPDDKATDED